MDFRIKIFLRFISDDDAFFQVAAKHDFGEMKCYRKGQPIVPSGSMVRTENTCLIQIGDDFQSLDSAVAAAFNYINPLKGAIEAVQKHAKAELYCSCRTDSDQIGLEESPESIDLLSKIGLGFILSVIVA